MLPSFLPPPCFPKKRRGDLCCCASLHHGKKQNFTLKELQSALEKTDRRRLKNILEESAAADKSVQPRSCQLIRKFVEESRRENCHNVDTHSSLPPLLSRTRGKVFHSQTCLLKFVSWAPRNVYVVYILQLRTFHSWTKEDTFFTHQMLPLQQSFAKKFSDLAPFWQSDPSFGEILRLFQKRENTTTLTTLGEPPRVHR